jgi:hypothetical protein
MKKNLLLVAALFAGIASYAQCEAVATLNEDFSDFTITTVTSQAFPQQCWNSLGSAQAGPWVYTAQNGTPVNQYAVYYTHMGGANVAGYIITPELSTIDGTHQLSFDTYKLGGGPNNEIPAGNITIQIGLISDPASTSDFENVGDAITVTNESATQTVTVQASATKKYIAFKFISDTATNAAALDNVVFDEVPTPPCVAVETISENFNSFTPSTSVTIHENCWSANAGTPLIYVDGEEGDNYATFYAAGSANTAGYLVSPELTSIDGDKQLSFDAFAIGNPAVVTIVQVGTLTSATDFTSFVAVGDAITLTAASTTYDEIIIPASDAHKFIAFQITTNNAHGAAGIDNVNWEEIPAPPCAAVATLDENFNGFTPSTSVAIHENCWSANAGTPLIYVDGEEGDNYATFYAAGSANTAGYLVSPELTTIDGNHELSFDAFAIGNPAVVTTIQPGTLASATDFTTFVAIGEPITLTAASITFDEILVPASETQKFIAFQIMTNNAHGAAGVDNVKWTEVATGVKDLNKTSFSIYPNPSADKNITINHNLDTKGSVNIYSLTGAKVFTGELDNTGTQSLNLSSLSGGMYIVKIESGSYSESKKLIIQ